MIVANSIEMKACPADVFNVVSDLVSWPKYLPHYRWIKVLENHADYMLVGMACYRGMIPINWVSHFRADLGSTKLYFYHQKAWTRGMKVIWDLEPLNGGKTTRVTITHDLEPVSKRIGKVLAHLVIGRFFIDYVANRTLTSFASYFERRKK